MEGRLHWAVWGLEQGFLRPGDLVPPAAAAAPAGKGGGAHIVHALLAFMGLVTGSEGGGGGALGLGQAASLAGCERQAARLASLALAFVAKVGTCEWIGTMMWVRLQCSLFA